MKYIYLILTAVFLISCKAYTVEEDDGENGSIETGISLLGSGEGEILYPVRVVCTAGSGNTVCNREFGKDESIVISLPEGEVSVNVLCGAVSECYSISEDMEGNPVMEMKDGNTSDSPLKTAHAVVNIEKSSKISLTPGYAVASVKFTLNGIPQEVKSVDAVISPASSTYGIEDGRCNTKETAVIECRADGSSWISEQRYLFPFESSVTKISISMDYGDHIKNYSYTLMKGLEKGKPYSFSGSFHKDDETGEDVLQMEGDFCIGKWDMEEEITIDFGEGSGSSNPGDGGSDGGDSENDELETFLVDEIPAKFDIFGPMFIWKSEEVKPGEAIVTAIAPEQWAEVLASEALPTLEGYCLGEITGWRMFTEEEAREFAADFKGGNSEINDILYTNGHNIFYNENNERYLCENAEKTFNLYGSLRILKAGEKTEYYLRPIKTMRFKLK